MSIFGGRDDVMSSSSPSAEEEVDQKLWPGTRCFDIEVCPKLPTLMLVSGLRDGGIATAVIGAGATTGIGTAT